MRDGKLTADERVRDEFNQWAAEGKGEEMEAHHISITEQTLSLMELKPGDRVLDLGCGAGSVDFDNVMFVVGSAQQIPWEESFFDKVLSVESFYYYADQERALAELFRVIAPKGKLYILINLYRDNPY